MLASDTTECYHSEMNTLTEHGPLELPCVRCGKILDESIMDYGYVVCECGAKYAEELLDEHRQPGYYREWLMMLSCTCINPDTGEPRVNHYWQPEVVAVERHKCWRNGIGILPRNNN